MNEHVPQGLTFSGANGWPSTAWAGSGVAAGPAIAHLVVRRKCDAHDIAKSNLVRLAAAVMGLAASVWFVVAYTHFSHSRFKYEHEGGRLIAINEVLVPYGSWLYALPLVALPIGLWLVCWRPQATATLEILLSAIWLLALGLAGFCLLIWQVQNVPAFSHMEFHF